MNKCRNCNKSIPNRNKYCSLECQKEFEYKLYINDWKNALIAIHLLAHIKEPILIKTEKVEKNTNNI